MEIHIGDKFGRWTVIEDLGTMPPDYSHKFRCLCQCGNVSRVRRDKLLQGVSVSCGCFANEQRIKVNTKHGFSRSPEYQTWQHIFQRCYNPNEKRYKDYGARGITVCEQWHNNFPQFLKDMGPRPASKTSIDRIDNNKGYSPENCRWASYREQNTNHRRNRHLTAHGKTKMISEWAEGLGTKAQTIIARLNAGASVEDAVTRPVRKAPYRRKRRGPLEGPRRT